MSSLYPVSMCPSTNKSIHLYLFHPTFIHQSIYPSIYSTNPSIHSGRRVSPQSQRATTCRRQRCGTRCTRSSRQVFPIINRFINQPIHTRNIIMAIKTTINENGDNCEIRKLKIFGPSHLLRINTDMPPVFLGGP